MDYKKIISEIVQDLETEKLKLIQTQNPYELFIRDQEIEKLSSHVAWLLNFWRNYGEFQTTQQ